MADYKKLLFSYNKPYLLLGIAMFILTIGTISYLSIEPLFTLMVSLSLGFLMIITFILLFCFLNSFYQSKTKVSSKNINDFIGIGKTGFFSKILLFLGLIIFAIGSYLGFLLYIEATSFYAGLTFVAMTLTIAFFYNIFNSKIVLNAYTHNHILAYQSFLKTEGNVTPPLTKEMASKNQTIFNHHLSYALAFDLESYWAKKFMPSTEVEFSNQSYKPFWYNGKRDFTLKNLASDLSALVSDLTYACSNVSGI